MDDFTTHTASGNDVHGELANETRAAILPIVLQIDSIPAELRLCPQWVCWKYAVRHDHITKLPINARTGRAASSTDAATWSTFDIAHARAINSSGQLGVGFVFAGDGCYSGVDLDDCIDQHGELTPEARTIVQSLDSYTEVSPSGKGVKIFLRGRLPESSSHTWSHLEGLKQIEAYSTGRYFTVTGEHLSGTPTTVEPRQSALNDLYAQLQSSCPKPMTRPSSGAQTPRTHTHDHTLARASAYLSRIPGAISGQGGHNQTYAAATALVHGFGLDPEDALELMTQQYNPRCQPPWSAGELRHKIDDAATKPHSFPRGWLRDAPRQNPVSANGLTTPIATVTSQSGNTIEECTDLGNARRLAASIRGSFRFCGEHDQWMTWDGQRWTVDLLGRIKHAAEGVIATIRNEAFQAGGVAAQALHSWAKQSQSRARQEAMVVMAQHQPDIATSLSFFDVDPWLLNTLNGTLDLRTGELSRHNPEDGITHLAPTAYTSDANCPRFLKFLSEVFADDGPTIAYVQRVLGYCLTGLASEQKLFIWYGGGANGKSVLLDTVARVIGSYAGVAPPYLIVDQGGKDHPTELADLRGRRLVLASESDEGSKLRQATVKRLTGDARIKARLMRQDYFEFNPTHKLILATNNPPLVTEKSEAIGRRLEPLEFGVTIPKAQRDPALIEKLCNEREGILAWMVRGALDWRLNGLGSRPSQPSDSTTLERPNRIDVFLAERCELDQNAVARWSDLLTAYQAWSRTNGLQAAHERLLQEHLDARGHTSTTRRIDSKPCKCRAGIRLKAGSDP